MLTYNSNKRAGFSSKTGFHLPCSSCPAQHPYIQQILRRPRLQTKLTIGAPNDKYEQEADRVADQVMRMPDTDVAQRVEEDAIQPLQIQRMCSESSEELLLRQTEEDEEEELLQPKRNSGSSASEAALGTESKINNLKEGGQSLDPATRLFFEPRFGHDFSNVRIHTDSRAAEVAKSINARAFTLGNHVVLGAGQYQPASAEGRRLLGHELTHVVQQGATPQSAGDKSVQPVVQRDLLDLALHGLLESLGSSFGPDVRDANLIAAAFNAVESSNVTFASAINIPTRWQTVVAAYFVDHPLMGAFPFRALGRLPIFYRGGWIMSLQPGAGAMTLDTSIFVSGNLSLTTYVHELVHVTQYLLFSKTGFLASYFGTSAATVIWRWLNGQPTNAMRSSPHEEQAYRTDAHFAQWYLSKYGHSAHSQVV